MSHYILTEDQENDIYEVKMIFKMVVDLSANIPHDSITLDPNGLLALLSVTEKKLPASKDLRFVSKH